MTNIKDVRVQDESLVVSFRDPQSGVARTLLLGIYEPAFNNSGHDEPKAVGRLIAIHVEEEAEAVRDLMPARDGESDLTGQVCGEPA